VADPDLRSLARAGRGASAADLPLTAAGERIESLPFSLYPVLDAAGKLVGIVSDASIRRRLASGDAVQSLRELSRPRESLSPDMPLLEAVVRMQRLGVRQLAVTAEADPQQLLGMLAMSDIMRAHVSAAEAISGKPTGKRSAVHWRDSGIDADK
jgi:CBS domain-containing protein